MRYAILCLLMAAAVGTALHGQVGAGRLTGVVRDQDAAAVPGATVTVTHPGTNVVTTVVSNDAGVYALEALAPGTYRGAVSLQGFKTIRREGVQVATGQTIRLNFELEVGDIREQVTVTADAPILRAESASLGNVVDHEKVVQLPLNGRSFITLASLAPGVALPQGSQLPRINGGRPRTNEYLFDGISVLQPEPGQVAFFPIVDAIQEFAIESNSPPAEFGRFNGGVVNLTTRAGSNAFHGTGFGFFRHEALNARNFFASTNPVKPRFRRNQFGGVLGGPIARDRTFFFVDYQGQRQTIGRTVISTVPTLLQRRGIFTERIGTRVPVIFDPASTVPNGSGFVRTPFANNSIPLPRIDPVALALLARYPEPTSPGTANNFRRVGNEANDQDQFDVRIDHQFGAGGDQVFGRLSYFNDRFIPVTPLPEGSGATSGTLGPQDTTSWAFAGNHRHSFSSAWLNELRVGDTRRRVSRSAAQLSAVPTTALGVPGIPAYARFPTTLSTFAISGYQHLGSPANTASNFDTGVTEIADSLTWVTGRHTVKMGMDWRWERLNVIQPPSPTGLFQFNTLGSDQPGVANTGTPLASFLLGQVQMFSIDLQQQEIRNRAHIQECFIQDSWKFSDRVTIAPGLRYTLNFPSVEQNNQAAVFNLDTRQLEFLGRDGQPRSARQLHKLNFGPRLGIVARPTDRTVVGTGYALVWIEQAGITTPFTTPVFPFLQTVTQRSLDGIAPAFTLAQGPSVEPIPLTPTAGLGQGVFAVDRDLGSGYVQQANVSLQRELTSNTSLEVAYVASKITHVGIPDTNLNQLTPEQLAIGLPLLQLLPNPYFGVIPRSSSLGDSFITAAQLMRPFPEYTTVSLYRNNVGTTFYHGFELQLRRRLSRGLSYSVSYTRSKLMDDASSVFDASILTGPVVNYPVADSFNRKRERDYSTGDIPHVFVSSVAWVWRGWTLTGLVTLQSGVPIAVTQQTNFNAFAGFGTQRPNLVDNPTLPASERTVARWFNTAAFVPSDRFTLGSASRNPVRGPSYRNVDLAVIRHVPVPGGQTFELRAEIFNALNTPILGPPNGVAGTAAFGTITTAADPRVIQLAAKILF